MIQIEEHTATAPKHPTRFQEYGVGIFQYIQTKSALKKAIKRGLIFIDKQPATTSIFIQGGEHIELFKEEEPLNPVKQFHYSFNILFEDDYLAILQKPAGMLVSGNQFATVARALPKNLKKSTQVDCCTPHPIHRLDYPTAGLLLIGKTKSSIIKLNQLFEQQKIQKTYIAITIRNMEKVGKITTDIDQKSAFTKFNLIEQVSSPRFQMLNLVQLNPKTGRRHQLRKHLFSIGNPILGDKLYYLNNQILKGKGLYLFASRLVFTHPFSNERIDISSPLPKKFLRIFPNYRNEH